MNSVEESLVSKHTRWIDVNMIAIGRILTRMMSWWDIYIFYHKLLVDYQNLRILKFRIKLAHYVSPEATALEHPFLEMVLSQTLQFELSL